jgi:hypothetical protein
MFSRRYTVKNWTSGKSLLAAFNFPGCLVLPFFSLLLLVFLLSFLSCIRTKTGFLSQWGLGGLNADTWEFFWDGFTPLLLKSLFLLFKSFNVDFHFALGVDYLPADIIVYPMIGQIAQLFEEKKNVFTTGFKVRLNWRISFQDRE